MKTNNLIHLPNMLLVGSDARNIGKTTFCTGFVNKWKSRFDIAAVKVTTIHSENGTCHRTDGGCGACGAIDGDFEILEITEPSDKKDTSLLYNAGAKPVYWLRAKKHILDVAALELLALLPPDCIVVCESNSLAGVIEPGVCILITDTRTNQKKPSAMLTELKARFIVDMSKPEAMAAVMDKITVSMTSGRLCVLPVS